MKLWEVLKELEENPKKRFISNKKDITIQRMFDDTSFTFGIGAYNKFLIDVEEGYEEIKTPVTWQEALEAWAFKGKTIRCTLNDLDYIYKHESNHSGDVLLIESYGDPLELDEIKFGTWYIED